MSLLDYNVVKIIYALLTIIQTTYLCLAFPPSTNSDIKLFTSKYYWQNKDEYDLVCINKVISLDTFSLSKKIKKEKILSTDSNTATLRSEINSNITQSSLYEACSCTVLSHLDTLYLEYILLQEKTFELHKKSVRQNFNNTSLQKTSRHVQLAMKYCQQSHISTKNPHKPLQKPFQLTTRWNTEIRL